MGGSMKRELLDFEIARKNGQQLSHTDEARLRAHQLRRARRMYLDTLTLSEREPLWKLGHRGVIGEGMKHKPFGIYRAARFIEDTGDGFFRRAGWNSGIGGQYNELSQWFSGVKGVQSGVLSVARQIFSLSKAAVVVMGLTIPIMYANEWVNTDWAGVGLAIHPPPSYPGDETITAPMYALEHTDGGKAMKLREGYEHLALEKNTRFDWLRGKPVSPAEVIERTGGIETSHKYY